MFTERIPEGEDFCLIWLRFTRIALERKKAAETDIWDESIKFDLITFP